MSKSTESQVTERPPVIAIMGHIDHGKSTLLDYIRKANVVATEAGGITQHISAYEVVHKDKKITFLDTPGHEAFETMRECGSLIADIAVLVVSAEEGVKTQTLEALKSIQAAGKPFIVAITKIDRPNANVERIKQNLAENNILIESWGGKIPAVALSAKTGEGVDELLDLMLLVAELEEFKGASQQAAEGYVLEANLDPKIGTTVTLVIKNGTLHTGDFIQIDTVMARVKKIENFIGQVVTEASFSAPVRVFGFTAVPPVGKMFKAAATKAEAEKLLQEAQEEAGRKETITTTDLTERNLLHIEVPIVIKADVVGTLEAVKRELGKLASDLVSPKIVHTGVGTITENDIRLATASEGTIVVGFNVKVDSTARDLADRFAVSVQTFDIIYKLSEWLAVEIEHRKPKVTKEETIGKAKILKLFSQTKDRQVIGGSVSDGVITKGREVKILRRDFEIGRGKIIELQEQKIKATHIEAGNQFGGLIEAKISLAPGDILEVFDIVEE